MSQSTPRRLRRLVQALTSPFRSSPASPSRMGRRLRLERLEDRRVMAAPDIMNLPSTITLQAGAPLQIALDGLDADGDNLTYTFNIPAQFQDKLQAQMRIGRSVEIEVNHASSGATDPAFTGSLILQLFEDLAPRTTDHFLTLAERDPSFFEGIIFHRVADGFVIQGGDPTGTGSGGSDLGRFDDEFNVDLQHTIRGLLSMAKSLDDTNDSQFFVTLAPTRHLDFQHSIFGLLVQGDSVLEQISNVAVGPNNPALPPSEQNPVTRPLSPVTMTNVTVFEDMENGAFTLKTLDNTFTGTVNIDVIVSDGTNQVTKTIAVTVVADTTDTQPFLDTILPITTSVNTQVTVTIPSIDVDGGAATIFEIEDSTNPNLELSINPTTGVLTVTPKNGLVGVHQVAVGVHTGDFNFDIQVVPIYISPGVPNIPDLVAASDTGSSIADNITRLDNSSAGSALQFTVNNVLAGAEVQLFAGDMLIGQGTVAAGATSITITTTGAFDLTDGQHAITAIQTLKEQNVDVGNLETMIDLVSPISQSLSLTVDTTAPSITSTAPLTAQVGAQYSYNVQSAEEGTAGFVYSLVESPAPASIDAGTGVITWIPAVGQVGDQDFRVQAADPAGNTVEQTFTVAVAASTGQPPVIEEITDKDIDVDDLLTFVVTATDADSPQESLEFSLAAGAPTGATINEDTGVFTWTPTAAQAGSHTITVQVSDGALTTEQQFQVMVMPRPVTFQVVNGELVIPGTGGDDQVTIRGTNVAGRFEIAGTLGDQTVNGVTRGLRVELGSGNDRLTLNNVYAAGRIALDLGEGNDIVRLGDDATVSSAQGLSIQLGGGDDQVHMQRVYIAGDQTIDAGAGNDTVMIAGRATPSQFWLGSSSSGATTINGGGGNDSIHISYSFVVGPWMVDGGGGNDNVSLVASATSRDVTVLGGDGNDLLAVDTNYFVTSLVVNGGAGIDSLLLKNSIMLTSATMLGGDGNDSSEVDNVIARGLMFNHGAGQDTTAVRASLLQNLFADLGDGDDTLVLQHNRIFGGVEVEGGAGRDRLMEHGNLMGGMRRRRVEMFG